MILEHDLKGSRCSSIHLNNLCKRTGCKYLEQEGQMYLYLKQEGQDVPLLLTWVSISIVYNKMLARAKRVHFDVGIIKCICYDLCDIQHVKFSLQTIWFTVCLTLTATIKLKFLNFKSALTRSIR